MIKLGEKADKSIVFISPCSLGMLDGCSIKYAKNLGYTTAVAVDYNFEHKCKTDHTIYTNTNNADTLIADLAIFNQKYPIAAIVTYSDYHVEVTALANEYFHLCGPSYSAVLRCKNKLLCRMTLSKKEMPQPKSRLIKNLEEFTSAVSFIGVPCVIKPMNGLGSAYTRIIFDLKKASEQFKMLEEEKKKDTLGIGEGWVLEECLQGFQISVESCTYHGETTVICIHDKLNPILPPLFRVLYSSTPSPRITKTLSTDIEEQTKQVLKLIGFDNGISHTEYRISEDGKIQLLEINARTGGGLIIPSAYYSTNINLYTVAIDLALGYKPNFDIMNRNPNPVVFRVLYPEEEGKIKEFTSLFAPEFIEKFDIIEQSVEVGDLVSRGQRLGLILKCGNHTQTIPELVEYIDQAVKNINIKIDPIEEGIPMPSHLNNSAH